MKNFDEKLFTIEDLREAFKNGGYVTSWCDFGYETRWESFDDWFNEKYKEDEIKKPD